MDAAKRRLPFGRIGLYLCLLPAAALLILLAASAGAGIVAAPRDVPSRGDPGFYFRLGQMNCPKPILRSAPNGRREAAAPFRSHRPLSLPLTGRSTAYTSCRFRRGRDRCGPTGCSIPRGPRILFPFGPNELPQTNSALRSEWTPRSGGSLSVASAFISASYRPQHCLYFFPLPQGQGSLRPIFWTFRGCFFTVLSPPKPSVIPVATRSRLISSWVFRRKE